MVIDSPEAVVEHMERFVFPRLREALSSFDEDARARQIIDNEISLQQRIGPTILKIGYGFVSFPAFAYDTYGYVNYFPPTRCSPRLWRRTSLFRPTSHGMLVRIESLDEIWFPHFGRCLEPMLTTDCRMIWHCDGNLTDMLPRLLEIGISGFQGFQYEDGMDYERICRMKTRDGDGLIIIAGVSVTRTLPLGTPDDVKRELQWLVDNGPREGLFLGGSSSIVPGVPWENMRTLVEGLRYYAEHGR